MVLCSNTCGVRKSFPLHMRLPGPGVPVGLLCWGYQGFCLCDESAGLWLSPHTHTHARAHTHLRLASRWKMSRAIPLLTLCLQVMLQEILYLCISFRYTCLSMQSETYFSCLNDHFSFPLFSSRGEIFLCRTAASSGPIFHPADDRC